MIAAPSTWDVACRVVDHYGDVGIGWRLARQLAAAGHPVRLAVDGLGVLARIESRIDPGLEIQRIAGVDVVAWSTLERATVVPADVVVELLGCGLPAAFLDAMEARAVASVWIDFEHLTAEPWVDGFHGLPSPHPTRALVKHFFYPGFGAETGGLLVEPGTAPARRPQPDAAGRKRMSLFVYPHAPVTALFDVLASGDCGPWTVVIPGDSCPAAGGARGALSIERLPFTDQEGYDRLLESCDVNIVRGEDSFVRAQFAGRPLVWHPYRQADDVHLTKLAAFEQRYGDGLATGPRNAQRLLWDAWNDPRDDLRAPIRDWIAMLPALTDHAAAWRARIASAVPAVERLRDFAKSRRFRADDGVC